MLVFFRTRLIFTKPRLISPLTPISPTLTLARYVTMAATAQEYKLKGLTSLDLPAGFKQEAEIEGIDGAKVLVVSAAGKVSAIGAKCTHYGAPLVKGVLSSSGRITCPWHGACFNTSTGDVEDAPAFEPLNTYPLTSKDGAVYITATEAAIKAFSRASNPNACSASNTPGVVIVGGGSGAFGAVDGLRQNGYSGSVTVVSSEGYLPIDRPKLSKALITDVAKITLRDQAWYDAGNVKWVQAQVTGVDFAARAVKTSSDDISYTKLILASGGTPRQLTLPGFDALKNIFTLRTAADTKKITDAIGPDGGKKVVIIGSSFIGMEVANAVLKNNTVTVVGMEKVPLERVLGEQVGAAVQASLEKKGIQFQMNASVDSAASDGAILLKDGTKLDADVVILGVGVAPATEYLQGNSGITLEKDGSVKTDAHFLVDGQKDVYAVGDIATYPYRGPSGSSDSTKYTRIEHWSVAQNAGRTAATHIVDPAREPANFIPVFWSALGAQLRYCGNSAPSVGGWDDVVVHGDLDALKFVAFYTSGNVVVSAASMGMDPYVMQTAELMRTNKMATKEMLQAGYDLLSISP